MTKRLQLECFHLCSANYHYTVIDGIIRHLSNLYLSLPGRVRRSGIALHPLLPLPPPNPLIPPLSEVKSILERGWSTRRRDTVTPVTPHGTSVDPGKEALAILRANPWKEAEAAAL